MLYQCLLAYKEEYAGIFEEHYSYTKVTESASEKMKYTDFMVLKKELLALFVGQDVVGALNFQNGYFSALLVTDPYSRDKLDELQKSLKFNQGARVTLVVRGAPDDNREVALQEAWSKGDSYLLFE